MTRTITRVHDDTFTESGVECPACGCSAATVTYMTWSPPAAAAIQTVIGFTCGSECWQPWGQNNDLIAAAFEHAA